MQQNQAAEQAAQAFKQQRQQALAAFFAERFQAKGMTCTLCGGPSDRTTCAGCDAAYAELGL